MSFDGSDAPSVNVTEADRQMRGGGLMIDVREDAEWSAGHVAGARHIPLGQLPQRLDEIPSDAALLLMCRSGRRSAQATEFLARSGLQADNVDGGMIAWAAAGLPVVRTDAGPGRVI